LRKNKKVSIDWTFYRN